MRTTFPNEHGRQSEICTMFAQNAAAPRMRFPKIIRHGKGALQFSAALLVLLTLAGCASSGAVRNASPVATNQPVLFDYIWVETSSSPGGFESEKHSLKDSIITGLKVTGFFDGVSGNPPDAGSNGWIKIGADIKKIQQVSDKSRFWLGAFAGRARIVVQVKVTDLSSGNQLETFEVEGQSGKSAWAGTTDEAIQRAAEQVVAEIVEIRSRTSQ
jgi:hypothetical protein